MRILIMHLKMVILPLKWIFAYRIVLSPMIRDIGATNFCLLKLYERSLTQFLECFHAVLELLLIRFVEFVIAVKRMR